jgi:hypothetical protein
VIEIPKKKIQDYPAADSPATEPFEALVEIYYQLKGYITSSNKWFWVMDAEKQQRGYQDIDVLAINENEVVIVSVTANLDDKIRYDKNKNIQMASLQVFFERVEQYLRATKDYSWVFTNREIKRMVAYSSGPSEKRLTEIKSEIGNTNVNIQLISFDEMLNYIKAFSNEHTIGKTNNQILKTIQLVLRLKPGND